MRKSFTAWEISEAFKMVKENQVFLTDQEHANGESYSIDDIEKMLMDMLQPPAGQNAKVKGIDLSQLRMQSPDDINKALFG